MAIPSAIQSMKPTRETIPVYSVHLLTEGTLSQSVWSFTLDLGVDNEDGETHVARDPEAIAAVHLFGRVYRPWIEGYLDGSKNGIAFTDTDGVCVFEDFEKMVWFRSFKDFVTENMETIHFNDGCQHPTILLSNIECKMCRQSQALERQSKWLKFHYNLKVYLVGDTFSTVRHRMIREMGRATLIESYPLFAHYSETDTIVSYRDHQMSRERLVEHFDRLEYHQTCDDEGCVDFETINRKCDDGCVVCEMINEQMGYEYDYTSENQLFQSHID